MPPTKRRIKRSTKPATNADGSLRNYCTRCEEWLNPKVEVWLEFDQRTSTYTNQPVPPEHSQGGFVFGKACAKKELQRNEAVWQNRAVESGRVIEFEAPQELVDLAKIINCEPVDIIKSFLNDLFRLPHSNGSDEREMAGDYFRRTPLGMGRDNAHAAEIDAFLCIDRREYQCKPCGKWIRVDRLRYVHSEKPHFVCVDCLVPEVER